MKNFVIAIATWKDSLSDCHDISGHISQHTSPPPGFEGFKTDKPVYLIFMVAVYIHTVKEFLLQCLLYLNCLLCAKQKLPWSPFVDNAMHLNHTNE